MECGLFTNRMARNSLNSLFSLSYSFSLSLLCRLEKIIHQDSKFYLVFEFISMDLKKYIDTIPSGQYIDPVLLKVTITVIMDIWFDKWIHGSIDQMY